ncbi:MAG TPA: uracil-DNA glycosylase [Pyrinomonadaceae bacterium]|nr:uracil-DNA glycosylase [Pyrinomonadaceae bacterium]
MNPIGNLVSAMSHSSEVSNLIADIREQILFLQELGVDALDVELPAGSLSSGDSDKWVVDSPKPVQFEKAPPPTDLGLPRRAAEGPKRGGSRISAMPSLKTRTAASSPPAQPPNMPKSPVAKPAEETVLMEVSPTLAETADTIDSIRAEIGECTRCKLSKLGRKQIVHTTGNFQTDLMFVGEAPGADEDEQGFPFVGRAGKLLTDIIVAMGFSREQVCIGNINRCRPPENRKPEPDETAACRPFILREVAVIKPKVIVVLGATAAHNLLQVTTPISKLRGNFQDYFGVKVMPTFHPAYLLRDPHKKKEVWEDMKKVRDYLQSSGA